MGVEGGDRWDGLVDLTDKGGSKSGGRWKAGDNDDFSNDFI